MCLPAAQAELPLSWPTPGRTSSRRCWAAPLRISSEVLVQTNGWHRAFQSCTATLFAAAGSLTLAKVPPVVAHYLIWRSTPRIGAVRNV